MSRGGAAARREIPRCGLVSVCMCVIAVIFSNLHGPGGGSSACVDCFHFAGGIMTVERTFSGGVLFGCAEGGLIFSFFFPVACSGLGLGSRVNSCRVGFQNVVGLGAC